MSHDTDYAYWNGNTALWPYIILARMWIPSLDSSYSLPRAAFNLLSLIKSLIYCINWTASRPVQSRFYSTASNCSLRMQCHFPNYGRTSLPSNTRDLNLAHVFIIRVKTGAPTHLKSSLDIRTNISTSHGAAWRPRCRAGFPNATKLCSWAALPGFSMLCQLQSVISHSSLPRTLVHLSIKIDISSSCQTHEDEWPGHSIGAGDFSFPEGLGEKQPSALFRSGSHRVVG